MGFLVSQRRRGFTLVEVLFVVAIIVLLSSVVIVNLAESRQESRDVQRKSDIEQIQLALRLYRDAESGYPDYADGVVIGEGGSLDTVLSDYLSGAIKDPLGSASDTTYEYVYDSDMICPTFSATDSYTVLYVKTMERSGSGNWTSVCDGVVSGGTNTYGVVLRKNAP